MCQLGVFLGNLSVMVSAVSCLQERSPGRHRNASVLVPPLFLVLRELIRRDDGLIRLKAATLIG
jgi:hypothetical protein